MDMGHGFGLHVSYLTIIHLYQLQKIFNTEYDGSIVRSVQRKPMVDSHMALSWNIDDMLTSASIYLGSVYRSEGDIALVRYDLA
jgi:hypothetical protein